MALKKADLNHVVFMSVIEREKVALRRGVGYKKDEEVKLRETANIRFIDWAEDLFEQGMEAGVYIVVGSLVSEVIKEKIAAHPAKPNASPAPLKWGSFSPLLFLWRRHCSLANAEDHAKRPANSRSG